MSHCSASRRRRQHCPPGQQRRHHQEHPPVLAGIVANRTRCSSLTALNVTCMVTVMTANSRMASAVHIMSFVAYAGDEGTTSEAIAKSLQTNPVVVRKILKLLEREGLVALRQGRQGGVGLRRAASRITLGQIYKAVESETGIFALRSQVHE